MILTCFFSQYKTWCLFGGFSDYEGIVALESYILLFLLSYYYARTIDKSLIKGIYGLGIILSLLGVLEYILTKNKISLTLNNSSYLSQLCCLLFPFYICNIEDKKTISIILTILMFVLIILTGSTSALYVALVELIIISIIKRKNIKELFLIFISIILLIFIFQNRFIRVLKNNEQEVRNQTFILTDIELQTDKIILKNKDHFINIIWTDKIEKIVDENDNILSYKRVNNTIYLDKYPIVINIELDSINIDLGYKINLKFIKMFDQIFIIRGNELMIPTNISHNYENQKYYDLFTGRGYTWIKSMDILKESILIGKGPSTLIYYFDQDDLLGLLNTHGTYNIYIDRMNNWYLKIFYTTGCLSLIIILIIFLRYIIEGFKVITKMSNIVKSLFIGTLSYMILGLVNDSCISITPFFWIFLGYVLFNIHDLKTD